MSDAKTGIWSAVGAVIGGAAGALAGRYAATMRPRVRYAAALRGVEIEDAMVVGGATGAVVGAFIGGALGSGTSVSQSTLPSNPQPGQLYSYTGPDGVSHTATWNGSVWAVS